MYCTGVERCQVATGCLSGTPPHVPGHGQATVDACDSISDSCTQPTDARCDDGRFCNSRETCDEPSAAPWSPAVLRRPRSCTKDSCDEINDRCIRCPTTPHVATAPATATGPAIHCWVAPAGTVPCTGLLCRSRRSLRRMPG